MRIEIELESYAHCDWTVLYELFAHGLHHATIFVIVLLKSFVFKMATHNARYDWLKGVAECNSSLLRILYIFSSASVTLVKRSFS